LLQIGVAGIVHAVSFAARRRKLVGFSMAKSEAIAALKLTTKPSLVGAWPGAGLSVENS
jgi:hypothetical protein